jgi:type II secretory pathway component HofQ
MGLPAVVSLFALLALTPWLAQAQERSPAAEPPDSAAGAGRSSRSPESAGTIDLDLVRADIRNVLRLFAEVSGMNFVYGEEIGGEVTIRLKGVPWERALQAILKIKGLEMVRQGNIVRVASAKKLAAEREAALKARQGCLRSSKPRTRLIRVSHARAEALAPLVRASLSGRGRVSVDARTNTLVVTDVECP